jgi:hypothetical protein
LFHSWFRVSYRAAAGSLLLLPAFLLAPAQAHSPSGHETHQDDLADPALARAAQRYDWAQEGKGNGGWVNLTGADNGKPFQQKARFADIWHKGPKGWQIAFYPGHPRREALTASISRVRTEQS